MAKFLDLEGLNYFWAKIKSWVQEHFASRRELNQKQNTLVSGYNIKTINNQDILGPGNIEIQGGSSAVDSVNGKTGNVILSANDVEAVPTGRTINGKALSSNITLNASDVGALPDSTTIPTKISDLNNDSSFTSVSIDRKVSTGTNIADITIDGTTTQLYAPTGGGGASAFIAEYGVTTYADVKAAYDEDAIIICTVNDSGNTVVLQLAYFDDENDVFCFAQPVSEGSYWTSITIDDTWDDGYFQFASTDTATQLRDGLMSALDWQKLDGIESGAEVNVQSDWSQSDSSADDYIKNKPTIPAAQVNSDWNASSGVAQILNKPTIPDISGKADAATTLAGYGITDAKIENGVITLGSNTITPLTSHQSLTNYVQKSQTVGLLKNDGTVDTTQYGTYSKPSGGIPASDLASGVIPSVPVQDVTVGGTSVVSSGTAAIPAIPTVPTISTDVATDKADNTKTTGAKAVYDAINPAYGSSQPQGGMLPNVLYKLGTLSGSVTIAFATPTDNTIENEYKFTFTADSTAPTITWPSGITWIGNALTSGAPKVEASNYYECSVIDGHGIFNKF